MSNAERDQQLYTYPGTRVLRNKLDIRDGAELARIEARLVENRIEQGIPSGRFDQQHLSAIHGHLFQDVYDWAGQFRQVDIAKGDDWFHPHECLATGMADIHKRLREQDFLRGLSQETFAREAAEYIGDVNRLHPFREGNGRTQLQYLKQLGAQAGHPVDLTRFQRHAWIQASIEANRFQTERMAACICQGIAPAQRARSLDLDDLKARAEARRSRRGISQGYGQDEDL